jgi:hypothetical protein
MPGFWIADMQQAVGIWVGFRVDVFVPLCLSASPLKLGENGCSEHYTD